MMERKHVVLLAGVLSNVAWGFAFLSYPTISVVVAKQFSLSATESGLVTSVFAIAYAAMQVPAGYLIFRFGAARTLLISMIVMALAPALLLVESNFAFALISRTIAGIASGVVWPAAVRMISSWYSAEKLDGAMSIFGLGVGLAQSIPLALFPFLIVGTDWRPPILVTIISSLIVAGLIVVPYQWMKNEKEVSTGTKINIRGLFTRNMFALTSVNFASRLVFAGFFAWALPFLVEHLNLSNAFAGEIIAPVGITSIIGSYSGKVLDNRIGKRLTILISAVLMVFLSLLFGISSSWIVAAIVALGIGFSLLLFFPGTFALVPYATKQGISVAGITFGIFNAVSNIGTFVSPVMMGYVLDRTGNFSLAFATLASSGVIGLIGAVFVKDVIRTSSNLNQRK
jgi:predicted MFS family arabinose efflux permease